MTAAPGRLADILPAVAASFSAGSAGEAESPLVVNPNRDVVVLLIDGLGATLVERHSSLAPTLHARTARTIEAGFPATTATSLSTLATGAPCGAHGIVGYSFGMPESGGERRLFNPLRWRYDSANGSDAREALPPRELQQRPSMLEQLAGDGIDVHYVAPGYQEHSGLTCASFRAEGTFHDASTIDEVRAGILDVVAQPGTGRNFVYAYYPDLDANGHVFGPESPQWCAELAKVDALVADLLTALPETATLLVTGDHGMIAAGHAVDLEAEEDLKSDVILVAGEARVRHVYARSAEAVGDVQRRWAETLGEHARVVTREQALDERWFGQTPPAEDIARRIGDVLAVAEGTSVLLLPSAEPGESAMVGHHGAWTDDEQLVPLIAGEGGLGAGEFLREHDDDPAGPA